MFSSIYSLLIFKSTNKNQHKRELQYEFAFFNQENQILTNVKDESCVSGNSKI